MWSKGLSSLADPAGCEPAASIFVPAHVLSKCANVFYWSASFSGRTSQPLCFGSSLIFANSVFAAKHLGNQAAERRHIEKCFHVRVINPGWTSNSPKWQHCGHIAVSRSSESHNLTSTRPPWTTSVVELSLSYPHLLQCASACPGHPLCVCAGLSGWGLNPQRWGSPFNAQSTIAQLITLLFQVQTLIIIITLLTDLTDLPMLCFVICMERTLFSTLKKQTFLFA